MKRVCQIFCGLREGNLLRLRGINRSTCIVIAAIFCTFFSLIFPGGLYARSQPGTVGKAIGKVIRAEIHEVPAKDFRYTVDRWNQADGLPQNTVVDIIQTRDGYLWAATLEGFVRFDGVRFEVFNRRRLKALKSNHIRVLYEDREENLWVGCIGSGLIRITAGEATHFTLANPNITALCQDRNGGMWVGHQEGITFIRDDKLTLYSPSKILPVNVVRTIQQDRQGNVWFGTDGDGLFRFTDGHFFQYTTADGLPDDRVLALQHDGHGGIWGGTNGGGVFHIKQDTITSYDFGTRYRNSVYTLFLDFDETVWIGTLGGGLIHLRGREFSVYTNREGLSHNLVYAVYRDREHSLWIGLAGGGLNRIRQTDLKHYSRSDGLPHDIVYSVIPDPDGSIWAGTFGGGICHIKNGEFTTYTTEQGLVGNMIYGFFRDNDNSLWIASISGLSHFQNGAFTNYTDKEGLSHKSVFAVQRDARGKLWIATIGGGLNKFENNQFSAYTIEDGLSSNYVTELYPDHDGSLWVGTSDGLNHFKDGTITVYKEEQGLSQNYIADIIRDEQGVMWIGTRGGGLCRFKDGRFNAVTSVHGLYDDVVMVIIDDGLGNFWMSSNNGIFRVSKKQLRQVCDGKINSVTCRSYNEEDGMKNRECNSGPPAGGKTKDGQLLFPTMTGLVSIDPSKLSDNSLPPPVVVEKITVDGQAISAPFFNKQNMLNFSPGKDRFEISYAGLSYLVPGRVRFKIRLVGYDSKWQDVGTRRTAYYTNLPPDDYVFRVTACNSHGVWNRTGASLRFTLRPWFYQNSWFWALLLLILVAGSYSVYRLRVRQLKLRESELKALVEKRTSDLNHAKEEAEAARIDAEKANLAKSRFLASISHEIRTPMNSILGFIRIMSDEIPDKKYRGYLDAVSAGGKTLMGIINDILDLSRIESGKMELQPETVRVREIMEEIRYIFTSQVEDKDIAFEITVDPSLPEFLVLDGLRMRQVLINLTANAVKFTHSGFVKLSVGVKSFVSGGESVDIVFIVQDTGIGIPEEQHGLIFEAFEQQSGQSTRKYGGTGLGLAITRRIVDMMGGRISLQSQPGEGSVFYVQLERVPVVSGSGVQYVPSDDLQPAATDKPEHLNDEILNENLLQLAETLRSPEMTQRWENINELLILNEIEEFANNLEEVNRTYRSETLDGWLRQLREDLAVFDVERLQRTVSSFPALVEEIHPKTLPGKRESA